MKHADVKYYAMPPKIPYATTRTLLESSNLTKFEEHKYMSQN